MIKSEVNQQSTEVRNLLRSAGLQVTAQRLAVYQAIEKTPHVIADDILCVVKEELGVISKQAVYDALNAMAERGISRRIQPAGSAARYEHRVNYHHHLAYLECDTLIDIDCAVGKSPCLIANDNQGYTVDEAEVTY